MARLPGVKYLQAGPAAPLMSISSAMEPGRAVEAAGNAISQVSDVAFSFAEKYRRQDDAGKASNFMTNMDSEANEFRNSLIKRQDSGNWTQEWKTKVADMQSRLNDQELSNEGKARLKIQFNEWQANQADKLSTTALLKGVETTKGRIANSLEMAKYSDNPDSYHRTVGDMRASGLWRDDEIERVEQEGIRGFAQNDIKEGIRQDPVGSEIFLNSKEFKESPAYSPEFKDQMLLDLRQQKSLLTHSAMDEYENAVAGPTPQITSVEDIDQRFSSRVSPSILEKIKADFADRNKAEVLKVRASPEYQNEAVGYVSTLLDGFTAESDDYDEKFVEMKNMVNTLPPGSAAKEELTRRLDQVRSGQFTEIRDAVDASEKDLTEAYKGAFFGSTTKKQSVGAAIESGLLRDRAKLKEAGFTDESIDKISGLDKDGEPIKVDGKEMTDAQRKARFLELYPQRISKKTPADPFTARSFEAIQAGQSQIEYEDELQTAIAQQGLGNAVQQLRNWAKRNPDKVQDQKAVQDEVDRIIAPQGVSKFRQNIIPPSVLPGLITPDVPLILETPPPKRK